MQTEMVQGACTSTQSHQNLFCSLTSEAVQVETSAKELDIWPL